jgi:hypothetical protein
LTRPPNLRHAVLHIQSYLGEVAKIAEMLDPDDGQIESARAFKAARAHLEKRFGNPSHWDVCLDVVENELRDLAAQAPRNDPDTGGA